LNNTSHHAEKSGVSVEGEGMVVYEFFNVGNCGFTWPLSRVRINGRNAELGTEEFESKEDVDNDKGIEISKPGEAPKAYTSVSASASATSRNR
jgi:hypothetical protein